MKTIIITAAALTILALTATAQADDSGPIVVKDIEISDTHTVRHMIAWDEFTLKTTCSRWVMAQEDGLVYIHSFGAASSDKKFCSKKNSLVFFSIQQSSREMNPEDRKAAIFLSGDKRFVVKPEGYDQDYTNNYFATFMAFPFTLEEMQHFAKHGMRYRLGSGTVRKLDKRTIKALQNFLKTLR